MERRSASIFAIYTNFSVPMQIIDSDRVIPGSSLFLGGFSNITNKEMQSNYKKLMYICKTMDSVEET